MEEKRYQESRLCRLLGNSIVYQLVLLLDTGWTIDTQQAGETDRALGFDRQYSSQEAAIRAAMMLDLTVRIKVLANRASGLNYLCLSAFH